MLTSCPGEIAWIAWQKKKMTTDTYKFRKSDFLDFMKKLGNDSVDLILTDPPYVVSRETRFHQSSDTNKFSVINMEFGEWDKQEVDLPAFAREAYRVLKKKGTLIVFYDLWKMNKLADIMRLVKFKQIRLIEWLKTNPVPINSKLNYLTNAREIAVLGVKGGSPTFHSLYDNGMYHYPIPGGKRYHPTQKPMELMRDLIFKHSNEGEMVIDPFMGSGTTAVAAIVCKRSFAGCDINEEYIDIAKARMKKYDFFDQTMIV